MTAVAVLLSLIFLSLASGATREEKREQIDNSLKDAAVAEESYLVDANTYTKVFNDLKRHGFNPTPNVRVMIVKAGDQHYCLEGQHDGLAEIRHYSSMAGSVERGRCGR
jgi:hypothetical protein